MKINHRKWSPGGILVKSLLLISVLVFALPMFIALINAFKPTALISDSPLSLPIPPTLENIVGVLTNTHVNIGSMYLNSITITVFGTSICIIISSMAAYYLARTRRRLGKKLYVYFLLGLMVPYVIVYVPLCMIFKTLGISGYLPVLILVFVSGSISFSTFMFYGFIKSIPRELEEAAQIDGAGQMRTFWTIIFPMLKPCTTTVAIFIGLSMWNDFVTPLLIGQVQTITVGIYTAIGPHSADWGTLFAFVLFGTIPVIVAYILAQKQFISGLTAGALKG